MLGMSLGGSDAKDELEESVSAAFDLFRLRCQNIRRRMRLMPYGFYHLIWRTGFKSQVLLALSFVHVPSLSCLQVISTMAFTPERILIRIWTETFDSAFMHL